MKLDLPAGSRVASFLPAGPALVALLGEVERRGLSFCPLDLGHPDVETRLARLGAAAVVDADGHVTMQKASTHPGEAAVIWTSGTSHGRAVPLQRRHVEAHHHAAASHLGLGMDDRWLAVLPPWHVGGYMLLTRALRLGNALTFARRDDLRAAATWTGITHTSLAPIHLAHLPESPPEGLRVVLLGGDRPEEARVQQLIREGWPLWCTYGLTEACSQVITATPAQRLAHPGTVGRPLPGIEVRTQDQRLVVRGTTIEGELVTDDLASLREGLWYITGRLAHRIVSGGVTVDARAVEERVLEHGRVKEACVVGITDTTWGQRVALAYVGEADEGELASWLTTKLSPAERPRIIRRLEVMPRTALGKIARQDVASLLSRVPT